MSFVMTLGVLRRRPDETDGRGVRSALFEAGTVNGLISWSVRRGGGDRAAPKVNVDRLEYMSSEGVRWLALSLGGGSGGCEGAALAVGKWRTLGREPRREEVEEDGV